MKDKKVSAAKRRSNNKWDKENMQRITFKFSRKNDADILEKLASVDSMIGYLRELIREDLKKS